MLGRPVMKATATNLAPLLERFFTQRLMQQRQASPHTISSYRDTFRLLLKFAQQRLHTTPARLTFEAIDPPLITAFLAHLEKRRVLSARSRNLRLTAVHSFFRYVAFEAPDHAAQIQRVLAIPSKRFTRTQVHFLTRPEVKALLAAPDQRTWFGQRDHAFLLVAAQTGLRLSEMTGLTRSRDRKGPQTTLCPSGQAHGRRTESLAPQPAARRWAGTISQCPWHASQPRRRALPNGPACQDRRQSLPVVEGQTRHGSLLEAYSGHGPSGTWRGPLCDRPVARPRIVGYDSDLLGSDAGDEGTGAQQNEA